MIIVIMGVSGSGKTTIGEGVAEALDWGFSDADDFHSPANVRKMKSGMPLTDEDREPWLRDLRAAIERWKRGEPGHVLACSALKGSYREILGENDPDVKFVYLQGAFDLIARRLKGRKGHFFDALESPKDALVFDISNKPEEIISSILATVKPATTRNK